MKRRVFLAAMVALAALEAPSLVSAQGGSFTDRTVPGMQQADRHNPFSRGYTDMTPGGYARRQAGGYSGRSYPGGNYYFGGPSFYGGYYGPGYFGSAPGYYDGGYGYYGGPWDYDYGYGYLPPPLYPLTIPAETLYGPRALWNQLGVGAPVASPTTNNILVVPPAKDAARKAVVQPRPVNAETQARAGRMLSTGDDHFVGQRYREANERYRTATETAPDMAEAYFRQGQALVALGQYDLAAKAFQRGLKLGPLWKDAAFKLRDLYGDNELAKTSHMEALAAAAEEQPHDGQLLLLVGLQLYFDGQPDRARPFLERANGILLDDSLHLDAVLKPAKAAAQR
jgi:hypothetical protein